MDPQEELRTYMLTEVCPPFVILVSVWVLIVIAKLGSMSSGEMLHFAGHSATELPAISFAVLFPLMFRLLKENDSAGLSLVLIILTIFALAAYVIGKREFVVLASNPSATLTGVEMLGQGILTVCVSIAAMICSYHCKRRLVSTRRLAIRK